MKNLEQIQLFNLEIIPSELFEIEALKNLSLTNCKNWQLRSINMSLNKLSIFDNNISQLTHIEIPKEISFLINLEIIELEYHYPKQKIGFSLANLQKLKEFNFGAKSFYEQNGEFLNIECEELVRELSNAKTLQRLEVISTKVPLILKKISFNKNLEFLNLINCSIKAIPNSLFNLKQLNHLNLGFNDIQQVPKWTKNYNFFKI